MTVETFLFLAVAFIAIVSAASMLLTENAVHSALFLIVVMVCIAFLFLMLEAPFLAMVQIAVYAGAIMVLFLFVIMLLGAEKAEVIEPRDARRLRWQSVLALALTLSFFGLAALAIQQGNLDFQTVPNQTAALRYAQFTSGPRGDLDVYLNGELILTAPEFGTTSDFMNVPAGTHTINLVPTGSAANVVLATTEVEVLPGSANTVIGYNTSGPLPIIATVNEDLSSVPERSARLVVFNATESDVSLTQINSELFIDGTRNVQTFIPAVASESASSAQIFDEGTFEWEVIEAGSESVITASGWNGRDAIITRIDDLEIERGTSQLLVVANELLDDGSARVLAVPLVSRADPAFGSPQAIGYTLFTTYMLPFQMIALLLLVAMIGAVVLTHKEPSAAAVRRRDVRRKVSRPLTTVIAAQTGTDVTQPTEEPSTQPSGD
jgi:NADH-quinone oxidoreductase subunit J